jgi:hypothetical protein
MIADYFNIVKSTCNRGENMGSMIMTEAHEVGEPFEDKGAAFPPNIKKLSLTHNQKLFLLCFAKAGYNIAKTCRIVNITRTMYVLWMENALFAQKFEELKNERLDFAESILLQNMQHENKFVSNAAVIFFLKTQGRQRGYEERPKVDITIRDDRSKEEIDAIVNAARVTDSIIVEGTVVPELSSRQKQIPEHVGENHND